MNFRPTFTKEERISSQKEIDFLFNERSSFVVYPLRIIYTERETISEIPASILISVSKKRFKRAVKRNRLKRLIREVYRLNKSDFLECLSSQNKQLLVSFLYISNELCSYSEMETAMKKALNTLKQKIA